MVSVAVLIDLTPDNRISTARIALGGVAPKPWRLVEAEEILRGKPAGEPAFREAAEILVKDARPYRYNGFKVELARRSTIRALTIAAHRA
jgi:xanthine dehydrogenase YagS FAD-binding subunit